MSAAFTPPQTFGELRARRNPTTGVCRFCREYSFEAYKYSLRHYVCATCIEPRKDVLLPHVVKHQKFLDAMAKACAK